MGVTEIVVLLSILSAIVGGVIYLLKKVIPKLLDNIVQFLMNELKELRKENREEAKEFTAAVQAITEVASNHLTEFSAEVCRNLEQMCIKMENMEKRNGMRDQVLADLSVITSNLAGNCPFVKEKMEADNDN